MKTLYILISVWCILTFTANAQTVYVNSHIGNNDNLGSKESPVESIDKAVELIRGGNEDIRKIIINPGIYVLDTVMRIEDFNNHPYKNIAIEASVLPDDATWTPNKMPVIISSSQEGVRNETGSVVVAFLIAEDHVTLRGLKFLGYSYPNTYYFPIFRRNKNKTDLLVEQCMFIGDKNASHIQVGVLAHGNEIKINRCLFHEVDNAVVFWQNKDGLKTGNSFTNNIVVGATESAIWTSLPDSSFVFKNNVISDCKYFWVKNDINNTTYSLENSIIVNNKYYQGEASDSGVTQKEFLFSENDIIKEGEISLRAIENIDNPVPKDYLHLIPDSPGYKIGAGLFKIQP